MNYHYTNWKPNNRRDYSVEETTTIWPGMYGYKNSVKFSGLHSDENAIIGLVKIDNDKPLTEFYANDEYVVLYTHDKQTYKRMVVGFSYYFA